MAGNRIEIQVVGDTKDLERALNSASKTTKSSFSTMAKWAGRAGIALGTVLAVGAFKAVKAASALEEAQNAANEVFGEAAFAVEAWSKSTQDAFSQTDFLGAAKSFATFARAAKLGDQETAAFSMTLLEAAQDLSSFHDAVPTDVLEDLRSGLAGETEPLRKYGILVNEAALAQEAMRMGLVKGKRPLTEREKVLARQSLILKQLGSAQGDWARTMGSAANQERLATAAASDLTAELGQALLPIYKQLLTVGLRVVAWLKEHQTFAKALAVGLGVLAGALIAASVAQMALNLAVLANPFVAAAVAIVAIGVALTVAYKKSEKFRAVVDTVVSFVREHWFKLLFVFGLLPPLIVKIIQHWGTLKNKAQAVFSFIRGIVQSVRDAFQRVIDKVKAVISKVKDIGDGPVLAAIRKLLGPLASVLSAVQSIISAVKSLIGWIRAIPDIGTQVPGGRAPIGPGSRPPRSNPNRAQGSSTQSTSSGPGRFMVLADQETVNFLRATDQNYRRTNGGRGIFAT